VKYLNELETFIRQDKKPMNAKILTNFIIVIYLCALGLAAIVLCREINKKNDLIQNIKIAPEILVPKQSLIDAINNLPDGSFKANLMTVVGTEYNGDSDQLNEILSAYAKMKINEIKKKNQL
jgi:hypothetical protein